MTQRRIECAHERGELRPLFVGVYLVGPTPLRYSREMAAVLACGPAALISHRTGVSTYGLLPCPGPSVPVDVSVTGGRRGHHVGIRLHRTTTIAAHEIRERHGIPLTAPTRTLIDFAAAAKDEELSQAVAEAFALRLTNRPHLLRACDEAAGRRGVARLGSLLEGGRGPQRTRSKPERVLIDAVRAAGLPEPEANRRLGGWEVDLYWPDHGLVVEVDGYAAHSSPTAFERDRRKAAELAEHGLYVHRVTAKQVRDDLELAVSRIQNLLLTLASRPRPPARARARPSAGSRKRPRRGRSGRRAR
jgi:very-short-patch-repair endonuclease